MGLSSKSNKGIKGTTEELKIGHIIVIRNKLHTGCVHFMIHDPGSSANQNPLHTYVIDFEVIVATGYFISD